MKKISLLIAIVFTATALIISGCSKKDKEEPNVSEKQTAATETVIKEAKASAVLAADEAMLDDGEEGCFWEPVLDAWEEWGNKYLVSEFSDATDTTEDWQSEGSSSIKFAFKKMGGDGTSAHFYCTDLLETNWSDYNKLRLDVNNKASSPLTLQFYTKTGDTWAWSDTEAIELAPGIQAVEFDISKRGAAHKESVLEMGFVIYGAEEDSQILIDNLRLAE